MSFQVEIGSLDGTVFFSGGTLYPSANYESTPGKSKRLRLKMGTFFGKREDTKAYNSES